VDPLEELYRELILDHHKNPRNYGELENPDVRVEGANPLCGDEVLLTMNINGGRITQVRLKSIGCSISRASGSMMTEVVIGKTIDEARCSANLFKEMMLGNGTAADLPEDMEDLEALEGVKKYPVRVKCALLAWNTLLEGLDQAEKQNPAAE